MGLTVRTAVVESGGNRFDNIKRILEEYIFSRGCTLHTDIYSDDIVPESLNNNYHLALLDANCADYVILSDKIKNLSGKTKIVLISDGFIMNKKNIKIALQGYDIGASGFILNTFSANRIRQIFSGVLRLPCFNT